MTIAVAPALPLSSTQISTPPPLTNLAPTQPSRRVKWVLRATLALTLLGYIGFLMLYYAPAIVHPDANGYWAQGSLIWQTGHSWFKPNSDAEYIGMHWLLLGDNTFLSRYPPGFPLFIGMIQTLFGWPATVLINPALAVLSLVGVYLIVSRLQSAIWGIAAVILLAANSAFTVHALTQISHMPVTFCVVWGLYFLIRWSQKPRLLDLFLAGMILGCIPSTRYADSVVALGVATFLLLHLRNVPKIWVHYLAAIIGAMIPIAPLLIRNQLLFGAFWKTGYALTNEQTGFSLQNLLDHAIPYLQMLQSGGLGMMFAFGLVGMIWMLFLPQMRKLSLMLLLSTIPFLLVYMAYYWAMGVGAGGMGGQVGGSMRFLVPIVPLFVIAGVWAVAQAIQNTPKATRITIPLVLIAMQILMYGSSLKQELIRSFDSKATLAQATHEIDQNVPVGSVVVADNQLLQQLDFVRKWKLADSSLVIGRGGPGGGGPGGGQNNRNRNGGQRMPGLGNDGDEDAPSPQQQAKNEARQKLYTGNDRDKQKKFERDIDAWAEKADIYVVAKEADLTRLLPLASKSEFTIIKRIATPKPPPVDASSNPMSRMGGPGGPPGGPGGPGGFGGGGRNGRPGGMFGSFIQPGDEFVIARWNG